MESLVFLSYLFVGVFSAARVFLKTISAGHFLSGLLHTSNFSFLLSLTTARCWRSRLDSYIYDYLLKRNMQNTAKAFQAESNVPSDPVGECYNIMCCDRVIMMAHF